MHVQNDSFSSLNLLFCGVLIAITVVLKIDFKNSLLLKGRRGIDLKGDAFK